MGGDSVNGPKGVASMTERDNDAIEELTTELSQRIDLLAAERLYRESNEQRRLFDARLQQLEEAISRRFGDTEARMNYLDNDLKTRMAHLNDNLNMRLRSIDDRISNVVDKMQVQLWIPAAIIGVAVLGLLVELMLFVPHS